MIYSFSAQLTERFEQYTQSGDDENDNDKLGCLICLESIRAEEPVWSCRKCYECYHLVCVQKWSSQAVQLAEMREEKVISLMLSMFCQNLVNEVRRFFLRNKISL